jgi:two-component SAPR family response regulator
MRRRDGEWITACISSLAMSERMRRLDANQVRAVIYLREPSVQIPVHQHHTLQLYTLGGFGISVAGQSIDTGMWQRKQAVTLLKYLITQLDRPVHRDRLLDCLWPDIDERRGWERLKVTMYSLRRELRARGIKDEIIKTVNQAYLLRRDAVWIDAVAFDRLATEGRALQKKSLWTEALNRYTAARNLYRGDYLEEEPYVDWCAEERERLREIYLEMLASTAECHAASGKFTEAEQVCRKALVYDPCRENLHYALMKYLVKNGRPDLALAQYRNCQRILERQFGVAPLPETQRYYRQLMQEGNNAWESGRDRNGKFV